MQSGVVDGAENNPPSFYTSRHYEVCKYYSLNEHTMIPDVLMMSLPTWEKLSEHEKEWLNEAVAKSIDFQREAWARSEAEALEKVLTAGVKIIRPDKGPFAEKVRYMYKDFLADEKMAYFIEQIRSLENAPTEKLH